MRVCMRRLRRVLVIVVGVLACLPGCIRTRALPSYGDEDSRKSDVPAGAKFSWTFDGDSAGGDAPDFAPFFGAWSVVREDTAPSKPNVYAQTSKAYEFPGSVVSTKVFTDFDVTVRMKIRSGLVEASSGIMFRFQNTKNYYVVAPSVQEGSVRLYRFVDGFRQPLATKKMRLEKDRWYTMAVECRGENVRCLLNDEPLIETRDRMFAKGKIGLWSQADSVACFDDLEIVAR